MNILTTDLPAQDVDSQAVVIFATEEYVSDIKEKGSTNAVERTLSEISEGDFKGEPNTLSLVYTRELASKRAIFVGLGKKAELTLEKLRKAAAFGLMKVKGVSQEHYAITVPKFDTLNFPDLVKAIVEGTLLGNYTFDKYKTIDLDKKKTVQDMTLIFENQNEMNLAADTIAETVTICNNVNFVRDMINENADIMHSVRIEEIGKEIARDNLLKFTSLDEKDIERQGLNLLNAVGKGATNPPRLIIIEYFGNPTSSEKIAIIGKGITYDSGGLNLKPTGYCETMKCDMSGAAVVLGTIKTAAELKLKKNLIGVIPTCENAIGPKSYKPGDILRSYSGKTVFVGNTDAEGRLVLGDAVAYTVKNYKPSRIIDLATLTGAVRVIFGDYVAGLVSTDPESARKLFEAGEKTGERIWSLPLYDDYKEDIKHDLADIGNISKVERSAGTITGAAFIESFTEGTPWAHLDIAAVAWLDAPKPGYMPKFATGWGVRLLTEFLKH